MAIAKEDYSLFFQNDDIVYAGARLCTCTKNLHPEEQKAIAQAAPKRQHEFATGRTLARKLLKKYHISNFALLNDTDRVPLWPTGLKGSISHCDDFCVVAMTNTPSISGLGLDIEPLATLEENLWPHILTDQEDHYLTSQNFMDPGCLARLIFSAKEATYKALFPQTRVFLDFSEMSISFDFEAMSFKAFIAHKNITDYLSNKKINGYLYYDKAHILTGAIII